MLRKSPEQLEDLKEQGFSNELLTDELMSLYIVKLDIFKLEIVKKINLYTGLKEYFKSSGVDCSVLEQEFYEKNSWIVNKTYNREYHELIDI